MFARAQAATDEPAVAPAAVTAAPELVTSVAEPVAAAAPQIRHLIKMTVGPEFLALLEQTRAAMSHSHPGASLETLFTECMKAALAVRAKRTRAQTERPRKTPPPAAPKKGSR